MIMISYQIDVYSQIYSYGDAMLKKDFAEDSLQHELDLSKPLDFTCPIRILHGLDDKVIKKGQLKSKLLAFNLTQGTDFWIMFCQTS